MEKKTLIAKISGTFCARELCLAEMTFREGPSIQYTSKVTPLFSFQKGHDLKHLLAHNLVTSEVYSELFCQTQNSAAALKKKMYTPIQ